MIHKKMLRELSTDEKIIEMSAKYANIQEISIALSKWNKDWIINLNTLNLDYLLKSEINKNCETLFSQVEIVLVTGAEDYESNCEFLLYLQKLFRVHDMKTKLVFLYSNEVPDLYRYVIDEHSPITCDDCMNIFC